MAHRATRVVIVVAFVLGACHHATSNPSPSVDRRGTYQFSEHVSAGGDAPETIDIEGLAEVLDDSVTVDARPGPCRLDAPTLSPQPFTYVCGNVTLFFDRRDPVSRSSYKATLARNESRQICARYATDVGGRSTCVEFRTETTQHLVTRGGPLRLLRAP